MTLLHVLRKQLKWRDKESDGSVRLSTENLTELQVNKESDTGDAASEATESSRPVSADAASATREKPKRKAQKVDSASASVMKTLIHLAATSDEGYERDRAILSITGGNNIVDALKILVDPAFLSTQAALTNEIYDIADSNGRNVAHYAVSMGNVGCVEFLGTAAAHLFIQKDFAHRTPGYIAAALGQSECLRAIAESVPDSLSVTDSNGVSPAHASALQGELECIKVLTELAPHLFLQAEASQKTPAHIAVFADRADVVAAIAKAVPDSFTITDADQLTPAHLAIMHEKKDCLNAIMLYAPLSMQIPNSRGTTAEQMLASSPELDAEPENEIDFIKETGVDEGLKLAESEPQIDFIKETGVDEGANIAENEYPEKEQQVEQAQTDDSAGLVQEVSEEQEVFKVDSSEKDETAILKKLLRTSLQLETFLAGLRSQVELEDFEQDSLGVSFKLRSGSVLAMVNNGAIFSAIFTDKEYSTTILVEALTGGIGKLVEE